MTDFLNVPICNGIARAKAVTMGEATQRSGNGRCAGVECGTANFGADPGGGD